MELAKLSDEALAENLVKLVAKERSLLCVILLHVMEIAKRKSYLHTHPTLFEYLTDLLKYSHGSAQRRRDAALLAIEVPEILADVNSGALNLTQITAAQVGFRAYKKQTKKMASLELKRKVLQEIKNKSREDSEVIISRLLNIPPKAQIKTKNQADGSVRLEMTLSKIQWQKLKRVGELLSHSVPSGRTDDLIEYMCERVIAHKDKSQQKAKKVAFVKKDSQDEILVPKSLQDKIPSGKSEHLIPDDSLALFATSKPKPKPKPKPKLARTAIPARIQREVFARDKCCQYQHLSTGRHCGSQWQLQIDHIQPIWANGTNDVSNLRVLCAKHNRQSYEKQAGLH